MSKITKTQVAIAVIVALVGLAFGIRGGLASTPAPVVAQQTGGPPLPFPPNPYCGALPPPPEPAWCPPGSVHDMECLQTCYDNWTNSVQALYDFACGEYNGLLSDYAAIIHNYDLALRSCLNDHPASQDPVENAQCWLDHNASCLAARSNIAQQVAALSSVVYDSIHDADDAFYACADACCIHPPRKDPR